MIRLRDLCHSIFYPSPRTQNDSSVDVVVVVALSALALTSRIFDRTDPLLAFTMRCAAGGFGLYWLFSRCCSNNNRRGEPSYPHRRHESLNPPGGPVVHSRPASHQRPASPPPPYQPYYMPSGPYSSTSFTLDSDPSSSSHYSYPSSSSSTVYPAATYRRHVGGQFPAVVPAPATSIAMPSVSLRSSPSPISHQHSDPIMYPAATHRDPIGGSTSSVGQPPTPASGSSIWSSLVGSPSASSSSMTRAPRDRSSNGSSLGTVTRVSTMGGGFPTVSRAPANPLSHASSSSTTTSWNVSRVAGSGGEFGGFSGTPPSTSSSSIGSSSHPGNDRTMFTAATRR